jgi:hypothetical protein
MTRRLLLSAIIAVSVFGRVGLQPDVKCDDCVEYTNSGAFGGSANFKWDHEPLLSEWLKKLWQDVWGRK